ncbi:MAG TPA: DUF6776 family protein [Bordetella sp.]|nr:DUF6776 family protein [Bordetella sp.]
MNSDEPDVHPAPAQRLRSGPGFRAGVIVGVLAVLALAGVVGAVAVLFPFSGADGATAAARLAMLQAQASQGLAQVQGLRGQLAASDADLAVERAARHALEDNLAELQTQAGQLRDRLAFYDQLFPAGPAGTVSIRAVEITRVPSGLRYRVLLMRSARPGLAPFTGGLQFVAMGTRDGAQVRVPLAPVQTIPAPDSGVARPVVGSTAASSGAGNAPASDAIAKTVTSAATSAAVSDSSGAGPGPPVLVPLEVDQYRTSEGILALPADLTPTEVSVQVVQDGAVLASQQAAVAF